MAHTDSLKALPLLSGAYVQLETRQGKYAGKDSLCSHTRRRLGMCRTGMRRSQSVAENLVNDNSFPSHKTLTN